MDIAAPAAAGATRVQGSRRHGHPSALPPSPASPARKSAIVSPADMLTFPDRKYACHSYQGAATFLKGPAPEQFGNFTPTERNEVIRQIVTDAIEEVDGR